jgi:hypothetical protein
MVQGNIQAIDTAYINANAAMDKMVEVKMIDLDPTVNKTVQIMPGFSLQSMLPISVQTMPLWCVGEGLFRLKVCPFSVQTMPF